MARRITAARVKKWGIGIGAVGVPTTILLIWFMMSLGVIDVTGYSGDVVCAGTELDPCFAYINFTVNEDVFVYPSDDWSSTPLELDIEPKSIQMYRSWGKGWREIKLDQSCTGTWCGLSNAKDTRKFSFAFRKNRDYQIRFKVLKNNPEEDIKWGFGPVDPIFYGIYSDYIVDGDKVYIDDENIYLSAEPHTTSGGWVVYNFTSKVYTGNADLAFGFDVNTSRPLEIERYNPTNESRQKSYTCAYEFNYTISPNYFWCYREEVSNETNETYDKIVFEHAFETGDIPTKTAYWTEYYIDEWKSFSSSFNSVNYDYQGMNKWWFNKNIPIVEDTEYLLRVKIESSGGFNEPKRKYWVAIKPSSETIQQAINNGHFYALDPWTVGLNVGLRGYYSFDDASGTSVNENVSSYYNLTFIGTPDWVDGKIGGGLNFTGAANEEAYVTNAYYINNSDFTVSLWTRQYVIPPNIASIFCGRGGTPNFNFCWLFWDPNTGLTWKNSDDTTILPTQNLMDASWHHLVMTRDNFNYTLYEDGAWSGTIINTKDEVVFNRFWVGGKYQYESTSASMIGTIDEVGIWNRSLTYSEVIELWNGGDGLAYSIPGPLDTCTYSSGDWNVDCSDECVIDSEVNLGGNDLILTGSGFMDIRAEILNFGEVVIHGTSCDMNIYSGGLNS